MKKPANEYSDEEIEKRLAFASKLTSMPGNHIRPAGTLPPHLETERQDLLTERRRRQCCENCRWFDPNFARAETKEDSLGLCNWPADRLPYSLRYGNRERMAVSPIDGKTCAGHSWPA